jgi:hypothetical protein
VANWTSGTGSIDPQLRPGHFAQAPVFTAVAGLLPFDAASADLDGDGLTDMALTELDIASSGSDRLAIMHNLGGGRMGMVATLPTGTDARAKSVVAADLNGDGWPDLAWTPEIFSQPSFYPVEVALNRGDGTFAPPVQYTVQTCGTGHVSAVDVNGDGDLDLVVANNRGGPSPFCDRVSHQIRILPNHGDGTFGADRGEDVFGLPEMVVGADLNGDGITDLVSTSAMTSVLIGLGGGRFASHVDYPARGNELATGDLNGDGIADVATADGSTWTNYVLLSGGDGTFATITTYPGEQISGYLNGSAIALGDLNGDGHPDLAVANAQGQNIGVSYNRGDGTFARQLRYGVHTLLTDVNMADYDGDGRLDLGGPDGKGNPLAGGPGGVTVLLNRGP